MLISMDWSTWLARAIRSIASTEVINQLCPQSLAEEVVETHLPREITTIITHTYLAILRPVEIIADHSMIIEEQPMTIFKNTSGLAMHALTLLLILTTIFALFSFIVFCLVMCKSRSKQAYRAETSISAVRLAKYQLNAEIREHRLKQKLLRTQTELAQSKTLEEQLRDALDHLDSSRDRLEQLTLETEQLSQTIAQSSDLKLKIESLTSNNIKLDILNDIANEKQMKLSTDNAELTQENKELKEDNAIKHRSFLTFRQNYKDCQTRLDTAKTEIEQFKCDNDRLLEQLEDYKSTKIELEADGEVTTAKNIEISALRAEKEVLQRNEISNLARLDDSNKRREEFQILLDSATKEIKDLKRDNQQLCEKVQKFENVSNNVKVYSQAMNAKDDEVASLPIDQAVLKRNEITSLSKLEDANKKCDDFQSLLSDATKQIGNLKQEKDQLIQQLQDYEKLCNEAMAYSEGVAAKDKEVTTIPPTKEARQKQPKLQIRAFRLGILEARILRTLVSRLYRRCLHTQGKIQAKTNDLIATQEELNDQTGQLGITKMNYGYLAGLYEVEKQAAEKLRSEVTTTRTLMEELTRDLNIPSPCAGLVPSGRPKVMKSKDVAQRRRTRVKMFDTGASSFKLANGRRGRSHSIAGCETRLEVARLLPGRSKHLMTAEENEVLDQEMSHKAGKLLVPDFFSVMRVLSNGGLPYTPEVSHELMRDHTTNTNSFGLLTSASAKHDSSGLAIDLEHRAGGAAFWAARTQFDVGNLLSDRKRKAGMESAASQAVVIEKLTQTYDNRIINNVNQLEKYRTLMSGNDLRTKLSSIPACNLLDKPFLEQITFATKIGSIPTINKLVPELEGINRTIHNGTLDSIINGKQGLRSIISKHAKEAGILASLEIAT